MRSAQRQVTVMPGNVDRSVLMQGGGSDKLVENVTIENLRYGDEVIRDAAAMGLKTNEWVRNLRIIATEGKK
jgi:hypothetical protein